jgi:hypothetical protein
MGRAVQPFRDLLQRAAPVASALLGQLGRLCNGGDEVGERRLKEGNGGHWDQLSWDEDGWGCPVMYFNVI